MATATEGVKTSRPPHVVPGTVIEGPSAWYTRDFPEPIQQWATVLSEADVAELDAAVTAVEAQGLDILELKSKAQFPLPTLGAKLEAIQKDVTWGRGWALLRGVPVWRYTRRQALIAYWGIGLYWGKAGSNNKQGHMIGHIKDIGHDPANPNTRLYATHEAQPWHNDISDLVALLCLKPAKAGGHSSWASSITVHNEIVKRAPDLAELLASDCWYFDRKGEIPEGKKPYFLIPVFNYHKGHLVVNFSSNYFLLSQRHPEVPRLTERHLAAIKLFEDIAASDDVAMHYVLQPGDIQLLNNHTCLHHRTAFEDFEDPAEKRHLLRLWLSPAEERELPPVYEELYGSTKIGDRGAIRVLGMQEVVVEEAE